MNTYISLDLETTGFDPNTDQVIEIAAIKFEGQTILEEFTTLINPQMAIPPMVSHITGIKDEDLLEAPQFETIKDDLVKFLGNYPIIGHNISFDVGFLKQKGLPLINPLYDTIHLAGILLPGLPSYSLDTITRVLKIKHENKHRAASDAEASLKLFNLLEEKLNLIPEVILKEIQNLTKKSKWELGKLFEELPLKITKNNAEQTKEGVSENPFGDKNVMKGEEVTKSSITLENEETLLELFEENSALSKLITDYETRPSQKKMAEQILESFNQHRHLIVEAGTGTGKTFSYLLSAAFWSKKYGEKILVSTYTHNLQDQIIQKDFPFIEKIFPGLKMAVLKGRRKYLSLTRLSKLKEKNFLEEHEIVAIIKILLWLKDLLLIENGKLGVKEDHKTTFSGDLDELNLQNKEFTVLEEICCDENYCHETDQSYKEGCFLLRARKKAEEADIIVINHALLLQNALKDNSLLPSNQYIIIDEAHHLEKVTTESLSIHLSVPQFERVLEKIENQLLMLRQNKQTLFELHHEHTDEGKKIPEFMVALTEIQKKIISLFSFLEILLNNYGKQNSFQQTQLIFTQYIKEEPSWKKTLEISHVISEISENFLEQIFAFILKIQERETLKNDLVKLSEYLYELKTKITELITVFKDFDKRICWLTKSLEESLALKSAPLSVSDSLHQYLFNHKKSVVLTSATLSASNSFHYIREELGLKENFDELSLPSHFSYPDQVKIIIPENLGNPNSETYTKECSEIIAQVIRKNGGKTMVLFTSKKALSSTFHEIAPPLKKEGFAVLGQGISGGRGKILSHFKDEPEQSAILGTNSFWEGVDILGNDLTCVIIQKLPFDPPDDPIIYIRGQKYKNVFEEYQLPRAILRFKQGFGRLIRSAKDTGSIIILDARLIQKKYGQQFISSLPEGIKIQYCHKEEIPDYL